MDWDGQLEGVGQLRFLMSTLRRGGRTEEQSFPGGLSHLDLLRPMNKVTEPVRREFEDLQKAPRIRCDTVDGLH